MARFTYRATDLSVKRRSTAVSTIALLSRLHNRLLSSLSLFILSDSSQRVPALPPWAMSDFEEHETFLWMGGTWPRWVSNAPDPEVAR